jgi:hypothetical protein
MLLVCLGVFLAAGAAVADSTTFKVNLKVMARAGFFKPATQTVAVRGSFNDWGNSKPDNPLTDANTDSIYEAKVDVGPAGTVAYKFVVKEGSSVAAWEDNIISGNGNRNLTTGGNNQVFGPVEWNDGVQFQVDMTVPLGTGLFNPTTQFVAIMGAFNGWAANDSAVARKHELKDPDGDKIYVANVEVGSLTNKFKFTIQNKSNGKVATWEGHADRSIDLKTATLAKPTNVTLPWDSDPGVAVTGTLLFQVDITPLKTLGIFNETEGDTLQLRGEFNGWSDAVPSTSIMRQSLVDPNIYDLPITLTKVPGAKQAYKFFIKFNKNRPIWGGKDPIAGWEEPGSTGGGNRIVVFPGAGNTPLPVQTFNDIFTVIPKDTTVTMNFVADMRCFLRNPPLAVDKSKDTLRLEVQDEAWHFFNKTIQYKDANKLVGKTPFDFSDADGDSIYTLALKVKGANQNWVQYHLNWQGFTEKAPGFDLGRRRVRYARPDAQGKFAKSYQFGRDYFSTEIKPLLIEDRDGVTLNDKPPCANITSVTQSRAGVPNDYFLGQNYPNPFNPSTTIEYAVRQPGRVTITLYNYLGQKVIDLVDQVQQPGTYKLAVNLGALGRDNVASGTYFYQIKAGDFSATRRMLFVK